MQAWVPSRKHVFDVAVVGASAVLWLPVLALCAAAILILEGRPVLYRSTRRVYRKRTLHMAKFRTMRRDAEKVANRETVPVTTTRFLNIPISSPLYTRIGRVLERFMLTEMPQLFYVLRRQMSLVGNRPLPENVIASLREQYPNCEERFLAPAGLTGPSQLVGRESISDADRLMLEIAYCRVVAEA